VKLKEVGMWNGEGGKGEAGIVPNVGCTSFFCFLDPVSAGVTA